MRPPLVAKLVWLSLLAATLFTPWSATVKATTTSPSATGNRVLIVVDQPDRARSQFSTFFQNLQTKGYQLSLKAPREIQPQLVEFDQLNHDHLILLSPSSKSLSSDLSPQAIVEYLRSGGNVLFGLDSQLSEFYRDLAREFSLEFDQRGTALVDHFASHPDLDQGNHTTVLVGRSVDGSPHPARAISLHPGGIRTDTTVFSERTLLDSRSKPLVYRGVVHKVGSNPLAFPLIVPAETSYSSEAPQIVQVADEVEVESTSFSTPKPYTTTSTRTLTRSVGEEEEEGSTEKVETVVITPSPVPTKVIVKSKKKSDDKGWVAKGRANLEALDQKTELLAGLPTTPTASSQAFPDVTSLVSGFQLLQNSARAVFIGSVDMLKDEFINANGGDNLNEAVASDLTSWAFQETSVLKVVSTHHVREKTGPSDVREEYEESEQGGTSTYRIKDEVRYSIQLSQHVPGKGWVGSPEDLDLQVSLNMIDPFVTADLIATQGQGSTNTTYLAKVRVPDRHGVYSFVVDWKRRGWSYVQTKDTAPVRPFNHDEHPRFLSSSWPYVSGAFSTMVAFVLFVTLWSLVPGDQKLEAKKL